MVRYAGQHSDEWNQRLPTRPPVNPQIDQDTLIKKSMIYKRLWICALILIAISLVGAGIFLCQIFPISWISPSVADALLEWYGDLNMLCWIGMIAYIIFILIYIPNLNLD